MLRCCSARRCSKTIYHGPAVQYQIINSQINGAIAAVDGKELWRLNIRNINQEQIETFDAPEKIRFALGENIPFELSQCAHGPVIVSSPTDIRKTAFFSPAMRRISIGPQAASA